MMEEKRQQEKSRGVKGNLLMQEKRWHRQIIQQLIHSIRLLKQSISETVQNINKLPQQPIYTICDEFFTDVQATQFRLVRNIAQVM